MNSHTECLGKILARRREFCRHRAFKNRTVRVKGNTNKSGDSPVGLLLQHRHAINPPSCRVLIDLYSPLPCLNEVLEKRTELSGILPAYSFRPSSLRFSRRSLWSSALTRRRSNIIHRTRKQTNNKMEAGAAKGIRK